MRVRILGIEPLSIFIEHVPGKAEEGELVYDVPKEAVRDFERAREAFYEAWAKLAYFRDDTFLVEEVRSDD